MGFKGYKLKHKLIVLHNFQDSSDPSSIYARTFEVTLFISTVKSGIIRFDEMENIISRTLSKFSEKELTNISPFDELEPNLENMGDVFYQLVRQSLARIDTSLERLEISERPIETYIVSEAVVREKLFVGDKKIKLSSLLVENFISQSITHMISEFEKPEESGVPLEPTPQPGPEEEPETEESPEAWNQPEEDQTANMERQYNVQPLTQKKASVYQFFLCFVFLTIIGVLLSLYLRNSGAYPSGSDIYGHLFKSDLLYKSIKAGDLYPLYSDLWYNGVQPFRYWAPLPYYLQALLQFLAGGDAINSYLLFVSLSFIIGGTGWLLWGFAYNRMTFCTFMGCLWFILPDNLRVFFVEGNFPRMVIAIFLPYLFYFIWSFVEHRKYKALIPVIVIMSCITLCHVMVAAMTGITTFVFLMIYSITQKRIRESAYIIGSMLLAIASCGIWLYPALKGGLLGMEASATAEVMQSLSTPIMVSLDPLIRTRGVYDFFYFGLSIFALSVIGLFLANRKSRPGFYTTIMILFGTTTAMVPFLEKLPLNQLFWMTRFTPIAYCVFLLSLLEWKNCRRYMAILIAFVILLDCLPSMNFERYHSQTPAKISYTLSKAKDLTSQRVSLLDLSVLDSYPSYNISAAGSERRYTFGWAWQGASTAHNIVMINTAAEKGYYYYLFDRSLELGDDTVLVYKELLVKAKKNLHSLVEAAEASGYTLTEETNYTYIFHRNTPETFGVKVNYPGLAIGSSAQMVSLGYPAFEEGVSNNITDYSLRELKKYRVIYLSGFTYNDRNTAEELLEKVANSGTRIIIDMNRILVDPITSRMTFFDVTAQSISFSTRYPELMYKNKIYEARPFKKEYSTWNTVYLENVKQILGYSWFQNKELAFLGTAGNKNIIFVGYNFLYHAMETDDKQIMLMMSDIVGLDLNQLPVREIIPLKIKYQKDKITIDSPGGEVNTTLAYQDIFRSEQKLFEDDHLLVVTAPHTEIHMGYPYLLQGLALSSAGVLGIILLMYYIFRKKRCAQ